MKVLKFGGSSLSTAENMLRVKKIIESQKDEVIVVISAFSGVTDQLLDLCRKASQRDRDFFRIYNEIESMHLDLVASLFRDDMLKDVQTHLNLLLKELSSIINGLYLLNDLTPKIQDKVTGYGELMASYIVSKVVSNAEQVDVRVLIKTNSDFGNAKVNFDLTNRLIRAYFNHYKKTGIVPGYIASSEHNEATTLGRGGSDYTASIISAALEVDRMEIWTDVDGFMTADPKKVRKAIAIDSLSYAEAMELSHFGARVIYTPTIHPVYQKNIEIAIRNTFKPETPGTVITREAKTEGPSQIKGISSVDDITLITMQGPGMVGVKGISSRLFGALAQHNINVILITQASSEYSITFAINPADYEKAVQAIELQFEPEIRLRDEIRILAEKDLSIIAIVGEKMKNTPGISANLFNSLGRNGISVIATAQGSSELNISIVISRESLKKALNVIHEGFFLSHVKELHLYLVGTGTVGGKLLTQIMEQKEALLEEHHLKINVVGICNSFKMHLNPDGINLSDYEEELENCGEKTDIGLFIQKMKYLNLRNSVYIDCTADKGIADTYTEVMNSFVSVVTANKIASSSAYNHYRNLIKTAQDKNVKFSFETNVGAGLPIISTLRDLIRSGDKIIRLEAVLSGTLNFIFNALSEDVPLSKAIRMAMESGFSEPDPRIDLSGIDVKRKLLILARESGYAFEAEDIRVVPFLPEACFAGSLDDFWKAVAQHDQEFEDRRKKLTEKQRKLRYIARLDDGKATIELVDVDLTHPAYPLEGSNNIILITTDRYNEQPMVIRGYGAGAAVTAAGVFADIIRIANV